MKTVLSVDLGAGSGRVIAARYDGGVISLEEVSRFENTPCEIAGHLYWNLPQLLQEIRAGLRKAASVYGEIAAVGVDTWGVDYVLLDAAGRMLSLPYIYRDKRNSPQNTREALSVIGREHCYRTTGIQFLDFNTLFQLYAESREADSLLPKASRLLFVPDFINYALCGECAIERTIASTSGMIDLATGGWAKSLLEPLGIPERLFSSVVEPGTVLGTVRGIPGLEHTPVIAVGAHDTASAVAAVPAQPGSDWGYLATGTWALLGVETPKPVLNEKSFDLNYTHEGAVNGSFRFLKNCTGMWMVQELRRAWTVDGKAPAYEEMIQAAEEAEPFRSFLDPDYPAFQSPGGLPEKIVEFCRLTNQAVPRTRGEFYRAAMEGIVMRYRQVWSEIAMLTGRKRTVLHMIGGAIRDRLHGRMTADALDTGIVCGPVEGAAMGNAAAQLKGLGEIGSFDEGRALIGASTELTHLEPSDTQAWKDAFPQWEKYKRMASES